MQAEGQPSVLAKGINSFKKRINQELDIPEMPFGEKIAFIIPDIYSGLLVIQILAILFEAIFIFSTTSQSEAMQIGKNATYFSAILFVFFFLLCSYYYFRSFPKFDTFNPVTKYKLLKMREQMKGISILTIVVMVVYFTFSTVTASVSQIFGDLLTAQITSLASPIVMGSVVFISPLLLLVINNDGNALNFLLIQDFESIEEYFLGHEAKPQRTYENRAFLKSWSGVWLSLIEPIVHQTESSIKECLCSSPEFSEDFYKPFSTITLAVILGDNTQRKNAKDWLAKLSNILNEGRIRDSLKQNS